VTDDDGNRSTGVCSWDDDDLRLLASAAEDVDLEVCGRCVAGHAGHILIRCLPLVSVWAGSAILADHSDKFHYVASDGGNLIAQAALSRLAGC
jgi:hypothetical protein